MRDCPRRTRSTHRRGVLLLVVLGLLALFILTATTFVVTSGQYRRATRSLAQVERTTIAPQPLLDDAIDLLLRGANRGSAAPLARHSLLEDLYGQDGFTGTVSSGGYQSSAGGQLAQLTVEGLSGDAQFMENHYSGSVATVVASDGKRVSARILSSSNSAGKMVLATESFDTLTPQESDAVIVNGRPFDGVGYSAGDQSKSETFTLTVEDEEDGAGAVEVAVSSALLGHHGPFTVDGPQPGDPIAARGLDESYDVADFQNLFLSWSASSTPHDVIPSFHRPSVVNYVQALINAHGVQMDLSVTDEGNESFYAPRTDSGLDRLLTSAILRPTKIHHPRFDGGNSAAEGPLGFNPIAGPWDVDNDGDGMADSVWLDLGSPWVTDNSGRTFKPLYAIHCIDLDGRLNVNAHGNLSQSSTGVASAVVPTGGAVAGTTAAEVTATIHGSGYGPSDVSLSVNLGSSPVNAAAIVAARQEDPNLSGQTGAGKSSVDDNGRSQLPYENLGYPETNYQQDLCSFMSPLDLFGQTTTMLNHLGQPLVFFATTGLAQSTTDDPYEMNLTAPDGQDSRFTPGELEALLRQYDFDVETTARRLASLLASNESALADGRSIYTTDAYDIPIPNDIQRIQSAFESTANPVLDANLKRLIPFELRFGHKVDINRPFGDGLDNNGNSIVDEPKESADPLIADPLALVNEDDILREVADGTAARQLLARNIYSLLMALNQTETVGGGAQPPVFFDRGFDADGDGQDDLDAQQRTAMMLAQWAINVVDFRDADSIMTPFEFDFNPLNGWDDSADGVLGDYDPSSETFVVWGCERPELLITETLAWHDRRTEDLKGFAQPPTQDNPDGENQLLQPDERGKEPDKHPDQRLRPKGACFVELFNPWLTPALRQPSELYSTAGGLTGVDLTAMAEDVSPVWRLHITDAVLADPDSVARNTEDGTIERASDSRLVYFVPPNGNLVPATAAKPDRQSFFATLSTSNVVPPNGYAVIGSAGTHIPGSKRYVSIAGLPSSIADQLPADATQPLPSLTASDYDTMQRIELVVDRNTNQRVVVAGFGQGPVEGVKPCLPFVVDKTVDGDVAAAGITASFSVSEPLARSGRSYPRGSRSDQFMEPVVRPRDDVFDQLPPEELVGSANQVPKWALSETRTHPRYRIVHLQRLANPTRRFNDLTNPYRTIDSAYVDLTTFNSAEMKDKGWSRGQYKEVARGVRFFSNQRGDATDQEDTRLVGMGISQELAQRNLWRREPSTRYTTNNSRAATGTSYFDFDLRQTLGYLNSAYDPWFTSDPTGTGDFVGAPKTVGEHDITFPWLTWNNRPFASVAELLNVPKSSASMLTKDFDVESASGGIYFSWDGHPFPHLLNFAANSSQAEQPHLYRLFEFVTVPSRYRGDRRWLRDSASSGGPVKMAKPPFNAVSRFRDPGRVNLNTISDPQVWSRLVAGTSAAGIDFRAFRLTRGDAYNGLSMQFEPNPILPTRFANPFRAFGAAWHVPTLDSVLEDFQGLSVSPNRLRQPSESDCTLFRPLVYSTSLTSEYPFLVQTNAGAPAHMDWQRNPYFAHQALQRLQSVATNHSNVFAVWVTVGFFEGETWTTDPNDDDHGDFDKIARYLSDGVPDRDVAHPDGLMLGKELGWDTGDIKRHRAFYIIDRSIPVAFEPGENHNALDTVVLRRFIE